tara:strand:- start:611 stop:1024 length:414 start_codon:yes stop_codon:yes gene_type:complete
MKTTKRIKDLSLAMAKEDIENSTFWTDKDKDQLTNWNAETLTKIKNALLNGRFYASVQSVSRSGMSRKIKLGYIYKNRLHIIRDKFILSLAGCNAKGSISGCGMDMLFHAQYTLFQNLHNNYEEANYSKRMKQYNNF